MTLDPTEYKKRSPDGKSVRLDIAATTDDNTRINIEMQCYHIENIENCAVFIAINYRKENYILVTI